MGALMGRRLRGKPMSFFAVAVAEKIRPKLSLAALCNNRPNAAVFAAWQPLPAWLLPVPIEAVIS